MGSLPAATFLAAVAVVVAAAWLGGSLAVRLRQPRVLGEILAGIALGPSLLGAVWPGLTERLFPPEVLVPLAAVAQLGLVAFMFLIGAELDLAHLRGQGRRAGAISAVGVVAPLLLGVALGLAAHDRLGEGADRVGFALFLGVAMAITAFPVLAAILREAGLLERPVGALAMTAAAVDDVTAWVLLAVVVAVVEASGGGPVLVTLGALLAYVALAWSVVRPLLARLERVPLPAALALALASAWATEAIGVHAIFGAFLAGVVLPRRDVDALVRRVEPLTMHLLLPVFFALAGLSTSFRLLGSVDVLVFAVAVLVVAVAGKLGGVYLAARATGARPVDAAGLGVMMNARGLTEIVILTVGLGLGVIGERVFAAMVLMALVTTVMARPLLDVLARRGLDDDRSPPGGVRGAHRYDPGAPRGSS